MKNLQIVRLPSQKKSVSILRLCLYLNRSFNLLIQIHLVLGIWKEFWYKNRKKLEGKYYYDSKERKGSERNIWRAFFQQQCLTPGRWFLWKWPQETQTCIPLFLSSGLCTNFPQDTVPVDLKLTGATRVISSKDILIFW